MTSCRHGYAVVLSTDVDADLCALAQANGNCHEKATCGSTVEKAKLKAHVPEARAPRARAEERRRGRAPRKVCPYGHPLDGVRLNEGRPRRYCLECNRKRMREAKRLVKHG